MGQDHQLHAVQVRSLPIGTSWTIDPDPLNMDLDATLSSINGGEGVAAGRAS